MLFALDDPWVLGAYAGCILCVVFSIIYSLKSKDDDSEESDD